MIQYQLAFSTSDYNKKTKLIRRSRTNWRESYREGPSEVCIDIVKFNSTE